MTSVPVMADRTIYVYKWLTTPSLCVGGGIYQSVENRDGSEQSITTAQGGVCRLPKVGPVIQKVGFLGM